MSDYENVLRRVEGLGLPFEATPPGGDEMGVITVNDTEVPGDFTVTMHFIPSAVFPGFVLSLVAYSDGSVEGCASDGAHTTGVDWTTFDRSRDPRLERGLTREAVIAFLSEAVAKTG